MLLRIKNSIEIKKFFSTKILDISWLIKADDDIAINTELLWNPCKTLARLLQNSRETLAKLSQNSRETLAKLWLLKIKNKLKSGIEFEKFFFTNILDISWLIKADDDIAINAELLAENLLTLNPSEDQIYCHVRWFPAPNRKGGSKW